MFTIRCSLARIGCTEAWPSVASGGRVLPATVLKMVVFERVSKQERQKGSVAEWLKATVLKTVVPERVSEVRILSLPQK
jgi:hypothetical protein